MEQIGDSAPAHVHEGSRRVVRACCVGLLLVAPLVGWPPPARAQTWTWTGRAVEFQPEIPWSGRVNAIARHPDRPMSVLVATPVGGVFASRDGGATWQHVETLPPHRMSALAFHPKKPDVLVATAVRDFAVVWVPKVPPPRIDVVLPTPGEPEVPIQPGLPGEPTVPGPPTTVQLPVESSHGGIWVSRDGGRTWARPNSAVPWAARSFAAGRCRGDYSAYGLAFDAITGEIFVGTDCGVARSSDAGRTWLHADVPGRASGEPIYSVAALGDGNVLAGGRDGVFRSTDRGATWAREPGSPGAVYGLHALGDSPYEGEAFAVVGAGPQLHRVRFTSATAAGTWSRIASAPASNAGCGGISLVRAHAGEPGRSGSTSDDLYLYYGNRCHFYAARLSRDPGSGALTPPARPSDWTRIPERHSDARHLSLAIAYTPASGAVVRDSSGRVVRAPASGGDAVVLDGGAAADGRSYAVAEAVAWAANDGGLERHVALPPPSTRPVVPRGGTRPAPPARPETPVQVGSGHAKINALQIYEVEGQSIARKAEHLYFGTQDNSLWASKDGGATWPSVACCEGWAIEMERQVAAESDARVTFEQCGRCRTALTGAAFANGRDWPDPVPNQGNPMLVRRGVYVQHETVSGINYVARSFDLGGRWDRLAYFAEEFRDNPVVWNGNQSNALLYQAVKVGTWFLPFFNGARPVERVHLSRLSGIVGGRGATLRYPAMNGFGSLGIVPRNFYWYWVFAVDPGDGGHLIAPDAFHGRMAESFDGGRNWSPMDGLTRQVTQNGSLRFVDRNPKVMTGRYFPLVSAISFHPGNPHLVLLGARQGGVWVSSDRGRTWAHLAGSEGMHRVTDFHWQRLNEVVVATFGRGLWKIQLTPVLRQELHALAESPWLDGCDGGCSLLALRGSGLEDRGPLLDRLAAGDEEIDGGWLVFDGAMTSAVVEDGALRSARLSAGASLVGFAGPGTRLPPGDPLAGPASDEPGVAGLPPAVAELAESGRWVGVTLREGSVGGVIVADEALGMPELSATARDDATTESPTAGRPYVSVWSASMTGGQAVVTPGGAPLHISGRGFEPEAEIELLIDGHPLEAGVFTRADGTFSVEVPARFEIGDHGVLVRQGAVEEVSSFFVRPLDEEER